MKKRLSLFLSMLMAVSVGSKAQDVITLKTGEDINAVVTKIGETEIEYKKWDNQKGPTYTKKISDIFSVKYQNGSKDVFNNTSNTPIVQNQTHFGLMSRKGNKLCMDGIEMNDFEIAQHCGADGLETYKSAYRQYNQGYSDVICGFIFLIGGAILTPIGLDGDELWATLGFGSLAIGTIFLPIGFTLYGIGNGRLNWLVDDYNSKHQFSDNFELSVSPSLMCTNETGMNQHYSLGAALTLKF